MLRQPRLVAANLHRYVADHAQERECGFVPDPAAESGSDVRLGAPGATKPPFALP